MRKFKKYRVFTLVGVGEKWLLDEMKSLILILIIFAGCRDVAVEEKASQQLPELVQRNKVQNDSLVRVKSNVVRFANLYVNDMNNKVYEDSMEYWSAVQKGLLSEIAGTKYLIDSLESKKK